MNLSKREKILVLSMLMGDGYLSKEGGLLVTHCLKQESYLLWKRNLISSIVSRTVYFNNSGYPACKFATKSFSFFKKLRSYIYSEEKISPKILNRVGIIGLAIWYMDDGSLVKKKRNGKINAMEVVLCTYFNKESKALEIIEWFKITHNITFGIKRNKGKFSLRCGSIEGKKFLSLIEKYVKKVPCMAYKLNTNSVRK
jgi:hypothetical protein